MTELERPRFTFLGHATVRCDLPGGEVMLIDPWVQSNPACPGSLQDFDRLDAILITHGHGDHMADAVEIAKRYEPRIVVATFEICAWLESKGVKNCSGMNIGGSQEVLDCRVTQVQAFHTSSIMDGDTMIYAGMPSGFVVRLPNGYTFYHAGDTSLFGDMQIIRELYHPMLAFLPIGDHFTMDPKQGAQACKYLQVQQVVPIHWGTFPVLTGTPEQLREQLDNLGVACQMIALQPGDSY